VAIFSASSRILRVIVPTVVLLFSVIAWAADAAPSASRASLELHDPMTVAGTQLQSGKYRVEWTGSGEQVEVKIFRGNKEVVTTQAKLIKDDTFYDHLSYSVGDKGARILTQIYFGKQKCALRLDNDSSTSAAQRAAK